MFKVCAVCQRPLVMKPGGTRKDGTTYKPFMGCEVWDDEHKRAREAYKQATSQHKTSPQAPQSPTASQSESLGYKLLLDEVQLINERLNKLGEYLKSKLG